MLFDDEQTDSVIINYGKNTINTRQINQHINEDLYWARDALCGHHHAPHRLRLLVHNARWNLPDHRAPPC